LELVNGKRDMTPKMAKRVLEDFWRQRWLAQQPKYDLAHVRTDRLKLKRLKLV
jgi:plasmid maintenance system antidote protein VapI